MLSLRILKVLNPSYRIPYTEIQISNYKTSDCSNAQYKYKILQIIYIILVSSGGYANRNPYQRKKLEEKARNLVREEYKIDMEREPFSFYPPSALFQK